jgi:hypothetical protein
MSIHEFLRSYSLNPTEFHYFLSDWGGFVAGSAALALYLKQINSPLSFEPGDIDIWLPYNEEWNLLELVTEFFRIYGYQRTHSSIEDIPPELLDEYESVIHVIHTVLTYQNSEEKKIQCVFIYEDKFSDSPKEFLQTQFDLSICATWWDPKKQILRTLHPTFSQRGQMFQLQQVPPEKRIEKYKSRGFTWIEHFPHPITCMDYRNFTSSKHSSLPVLDILDYSEYTASEYLQKSPENILIKSGETYYAFTRKFMRIYMLEKRKWIRISGQWEHIHITPLHQSILAIHASMFDYGDYSIYEFLPVVTVNEKNIPYSVCSMKCYTVSDWERNVCTTLLNP